MTNLSLVLSPLDQLTVPWQFSLILVGDWKELDRLDTVDYLSVNYSKPLGCVSGEIYFGVGRSLFGLMYYWHWILN